VLPLERPAISLLQIYAQIPLENITLKAAAHQRPLAFLVERSRYAAEGFFIFTSLTFNFEGFEENYYEHR